MPRVSYVNGRYVPHGEATIHVEDRGFQFADSIYEVIAIQNGRLVDAARHFDRLERSLRELRIPVPMPRAALEVVIREVVRRNRVGRGTVYVQVTRGRARREHAFPKSPVPGLVVTARPTRPQPAALLAEGVSVITIPDIRWARRDIKSTALIANVLCRQQATEAGAYEAWLVDADGMVTEGTASNAWIVTRDRHLVTRTADHSILCGITRLAVADLAATQGLVFEERPFSVEEAKRAAEAFLTGTSSIVLPVVRIDGAPVGDGRPGPVARSLRAAYDAMSASAVA